MHDSPVTLRHATSGDIDRVNTLIEAAIATWNLPERVKRLSLPTYRYDEDDLAHLDLVVAETGGSDMVGVAAWEPAEARDEALQGAHARVYFETPRSEVSTKRTRRPTSSDVRPSSRSFSRATSRRSLALKRR